MSKFYPNESEWNRRRPRHEVDVGLVTFPGWEIDETYGEGELLWADDPFDGSGYDCTRFDRVTTGSGSIGGSVGGGFRLARQRARAVWNGGKGDLKESEWESIRRAFKNECVYCGMWGRLVLEHVVPIYRGGDTTLGNCVPACSVCNNAKGPMPPEVFLAMYPKRAIEFTRRVLEANGLT